MLSLQVPSLRAARPRQLVAPGLWTAFIVIPARGWGWLDGVPISPLETAAIALVWWTWAATRHLPGARLLTMLVVAKIALGAAFVDRGFQARYYPNDAWSAPHARSTEFPDRPYTRLDDRLAFGEGRADLPLHFYNDVHFNFYQATEPNRERLPYSVVWEGFFRAGDRRGSATFYAIAEDDASGGVWIDGQPVVLLDRASSRSGSIALEPGWHALRVSVAAPQGADRAFEAGEIVDDEARPFDGTHVFPTPVETAPMAVDATLRRTSRLIDLGLLSWLAALVLLRLRDAVRDAKVGRLLWLGAIAEALSYALPYANRVTVLGGGDDMLMYEHLSRVIVLGDPLLAEPGLGGGQGTPFYFQPLYPYFLAAAHAAFGEDLFGIVFAQRLLVAVTVAVCGAITTRLFGTRAGWIAVIGGSLFLYLKLGRWSYVLLAEPLFTPMIVLWAWLLIRLAAEPPPHGRLVLAGLVGGMSTLIRSTLLLAWPVILPVWGASLRGRRIRTVGVLVVTMAAVVGTATLRNWIVSERFVLVTTSFGINLAIGNQPSRSLTPAPPGRAAVYERFRLDDGTRRVVEYALQAPGDLAAHLGRKAIYALGLYDLSGLRVFRGTAWSYIGMWIIAIVGIGRVTRTVAPPRSAVLWLPLILALCHFAAVVVMFPWGYGDRLIVPLYPLLIPYAAVGLEPGVRRGEPYVLRAGSVLTAAWITARRHIVLYTGVGLAWMAHRARTRGVTALRNRRDWAYLAYSAAAFYSLQRLELVTALLLPLSAFVIVRLTRADLAHRLIGAAVWSAAFVRIAQGGSRSPEAVHDPLFWGVIAAIVLAVSALTRRWPIAAAATAAIAGGCTMVAMLLPVFPDFEAAVPRLDVTTMGESLSRAAELVGSLATVCLLAAWLQAIIAGGVSATMGRVAAAARGALIAALVLALAGAVPSPGADAAVWLVVLGSLLGLVEGRARGI